MKKRNFVYFKKDINKDPPRYSKRGFLVEWPKWNRKYFLYFFIRILVFLFDYLIPLIIQLIMVFLTKRSFIIQLSIISIIYFQTYYFISMIITSGKTFGMVIGKMRVVHKSGFSTTWLNYFIRAIVMSLYSIPFFGLILIALNFFSLFLLRGFTLFDLISSTILITERQYSILRKVDKN